MSDQVKSVLKGAAVASVGALLTYLSQWAAGYQIDLQPVIVACFSVAVNIFRKWAGIP
jgi:hypothetical protein